MMRETSTIVLYGVVLGIGLLACTRNQDEMAAPALPANHTTPAVAPVTPPAASTAAAAADAGSNPLIVASSGEGAHVSDRSGASLYYVEGDTDGSKCGKPCVDSWPPLLATDAAPTAGNGLESGKVGVITRADGSRQVTYDKHPLYRYAADGGADSTAGNGVQDKWGHWHLIDPKGGPVAAAPAK